MHCAAAARASSERGDLGRGMRHGRAIPFADGGGVGGRRRGLRLAHRRDARPGRRQQAGIAGLRQVLPIFLRHLGPHRVELDARGIEDVGVIGRPQTPRRRRRAARRRGARAEGQRAVPRARDRSGVRIDQSMSAKRRTKKGAFASTMWCSGSNQATKRRRAAVRRQLAEAHEGAHLVDVAAHGLAPAGSSRCTSGSARIAQQPAPVLQHASSA